MLAVATVAVVIPAPSRAAVLLSRPEPGCLGRFCTKGGGRGARSVGGAWDHRGPVTSGQGCTPAEAGFHPWETVVAALRLQISQDSKALTC